MVKQAIADIRVTKNPKISDKARFVMLGFLIPYAFFGYWGFAVLFGLFYLKTYQLTVERTYSADELLEEALDHTIKHQKKKVVAKPRKNPPLREHTLDYVLGKEKVRHGQTLQPKLNLVEALIKQ